MGLMIDFRDIFDKVVLIDVRETFELLKVGKNIVN